MFKKLLIVFIMIAYSVPGFAAVRFEDGSKTITTSGTAVALTSTSTQATTIIVCGDTNNTGKVLVGATPVATAGSQQGVILSAGQCASLSPSYGTIDVSTVFVDATVSGEEASYFWMNSNA